MYGLLLVLIASILGLVGLGMLVAAAFMLLRNIPEKKDLAVVIILLILGLLLVFAPVLIFVLLRFAR